MIRSFHAHICCFAFALNLSALAVAQPVPPPDTFQGKGFFIEDTSLAIKMASNLTIEIKHSPPTSEADYKRGLDMVVQQVVNYGANWVAVKACDGDKRSDQFNYDLYLAFNNDANAGGDASKLPKLIGYHVLYASSDDTSVVTQEIDREIAKANEALAGEKLGSEPADTPAYPPKGWIVMPADGYFGNTQNHTSKQCRDAKKQSAKQYLTGIKTKIDTGIALAYSPTIGGHDEDTTTGNGADDQKTGNGKYGKKWLKQHLYKKERLALLDEYLNPTDSTTEAKASIVIPRIFWGKNQGSTNPLRLSGPLDDAYRAWLRHFKVHKDDNQWTQSIVDVGQSDTVDRVPDFLNFVNVDNGDFQQATHGIALWVYEKALQNELDDFKNASFPFAGRGKHKPCPKCGPNDDCVP